jgi:hypothetical protein
VVERVVLMRFRYGFVDEDDGQGMSGADEPSCLLFDSAMAGLCLCRAVLLAPRLGSYMWKYSSYPLLPGYWINPRAAGSVFHTGDASSTCMQIYPVQCWRRRLETLPHRRCESIACNLYLTPGSEDVSKLMTAEGVMRLAAVVKSYSVLTRSWNCL